MERPITALLIEDNPADADLIREALEDARLADAADPGFALVHVDRLGEGLARLREGGVDVLLLDLSLPDSHGIETFHRAQRGAPEVPIVVLSGLADEALAVRTVREGAQDYLVKGEVDGRLLLRSLRYAIERKRAEEEHARFVREQAARQEAEAARQRIEVLAAQRAAILAQTAEGVVVVDPTGRITFVNEAARRLHGLGQRDEPIARYGDGCQLLTADGAPHPADDLPLERALARGETVVDALWRVRRADGSEIVVQGSATPVRAEDGAALGAVLVMRDVTARYDLERERDAFLAAASHDLKNPLTAIKGTAQILRRQLRRGPADPERLDVSLSAVESTAARMVSMIDELLDVARVRMGQPLELHFETTDLVALARRFVETQQLATDQHRIVVQADDEVVGNWDPVRLERVLGNLIGNAIKYSPNGGEILVAIGHAERDGTPGATLRIRDEGIGIPAADLERIFERFQRGSNAIGRVAGTGIGLAGARQIVEQHGGRISVESRDGAGSTFTVWLPLRPAAAREENASANLAEVSG